MNELESGFSKLGRDYRVAAISFDSGEDSELALLAAKKYHAQLKSPTDAGAWYFMTGREQAIQTLMKQFGFVYEKLGDEIGHSTAVFVVSPHGSITQHFTGIEYPALAVRMALAKARLRSPAGRGPG